MQHCSLQSTQLTAQQVRKKFVAAPLAAAVVALYAVPAAAIIAGSAAAAVNDAAAAIQPSVPNTTKPIFSVIFLSYRVCCHCCRTGLRLLKLDFETT